MFVKNYERVNYFYEISLRVVSVYEIEKVSAGLIYLDSKMTCPDSPEISRYPRHSLIKPRSTEDQPPPFPDPAIRDQPFILVIISHLKMAEGGRS